MSKQQAERFFERIESDLDLQRQVQHVSCADDVLTLAHRHGFEGSMEELREAARSRASDQGELSPAELDQVTGGAPSSWERALGKIWAFLTPRSNSADQGGSNAVAGVRG